MNKTSFFSAMKPLAKKIIVGVFWFILGRNNLVRFARFLKNEARLDVSNNIFSNGECLVQEVVLKCSSFDMFVVVFDVGANIGEWTEVLMNKCGELGLDRRNIKVYAFEPCTSTYERLKKAVGIWGDQVTTVKKALSNNTGKATFYAVAECAGRNSLYQQLDENTALRETVELITIDMFCEISGISHITFLKIDAEGHDMLVMEGASKMISQKAINLIQFEYSYRWINSRRYLRDAFDFLTPHSYKIGKISPKGIEFYKAWHPELESFQEGNYLACLDEWARCFPIIPWWNDE